MGSPELEMPLQLHRLHEVRGVYHVTKGCKAIEGPVDRPQVGKVCHKLSRDETKGFRAMTALYETVLGLIQT